MTPIDNMEEELRVLKASRRIGIPPESMILHRIHLKQLYDNLIAYSPVTVEHSPYKICFVIPTESASYIVRAIQEDEILRTRICTTYNGKKTVLRSFADAWNQFKSLQVSIAASFTPYETMWKLSKKYGYKMATTYMPEYAKSIYQYFQPTTVLDPCAGWGDRLIGAAASGVSRYIGFDPNIYLRPGYVELMRIPEHLLNESASTTTTLCFENGYEIHSIPFEHNCIESDSVDLVFTSPPFFDYEIYSDTNPTYENWIESFYTPLFIESCRCVQPGKFVVMYIETTSAGEIEHFLTTIVPTICPLTLAFTIGCASMTRTDRMRTVWCFQKAARTSSIL